MKYLTQQEIKQNLGTQAAMRVEEGMLVGLGSGSTATYFIEKLIQRCKEGLKISAIATSVKSETLAAQGNIPIFPMDKFVQIDLTVDGADEIDSQNRMIKGGGGALAREKILASSSSEMLVLVDESKLVPLLGKFGVPVEILPFCYQTTVEKMKRLGFDGKMRFKSDGSFYVTDNGNFIFDLHHPQFFPNPEDAHSLLSGLPGVVETGFFFRLPAKAMIGYRDGHIAFRSPHG